MSIVTISVSAAYIWVSKLAAVSVVARFIVVVVMMVTLSFA